MDALPPLPQSISGYAAPCSATSSLPSGQRRREVFSEDRGGQRRIAAPVEERTHQGERLRAAGEEAVERDARLRRQPDRLGPEAEEDLAPGGPGNRRQENLLAADRHHRPVHRVSRHPAP